MAEPSAQPFSATSYPTSSRRRVSASLALGAALFTGLAFTYDFSCWLSYFYWRYSIPIFQLRNSYVYYLYTFRCHDSKLFSDSVKLLIFIHLYKIIFYLEGCRIPFVIRVRFCRRPERGDQCACVHVIVIQHPWRGPWRLRWLQDHPQIQVVQHHHSRHTWVALPASLTLF